MIVLAAVAYQFGQPPGALGGGLPSAGGEHPADAELEQHVQRRELVLDQVERRLKTTGAPPAASVSRAVTSRSISPAAVSAPTTTAVAPAPSADRVSATIAAISPLVVTEVTLPGADQDVHRERADADDLLLQTRGWGEAAGLQRGAQFEPVGATVPGRPRLHWRSPHRPR